MKGPLANAMYEDSHIFYYYSIPESPKKHTIFNFTGGKVYSPDIVLSLYPCLVLTLFVSWTDVEILHRKPNLFLLFKYMFKSKDFL